VKHEPIYLLSFCVKTSNYQNIFHFKGVYNGHEIKEVVLTGGRFELLEEYLINLHVLGVRNKILYGEVMSQKRLNHLR
jgi:hypothetical protein